MEWSSLSVAAKSRQALWKSFFESPSFAPPVKVTSRRAGAGLLSSSLKLQLIVGDWNHWLMKSLRHVLKLVKASLSELRELLGAV